MARPVVPRRVCCHSAGPGFRPIGPVTKVNAIRLAQDGLEAIRLADVEGLYQDAAAERMGVSRQTYARILSRARHAVASALVERRMLVFDGGPVIQEAEEPTACPIHGGPRRQGRTCHCPGGRHAHPCGKHCACPGRGAKPSSKPK
jgi:uncharacterized protein